MPLSYYIFSPKIIFLMLGVVVLGQLFKHLFQKANH
jgi:hypothetical protein